MKVHNPHTCNCDKVSRCSIFIHPSKEVQYALNNLMEVMAVFDDSTESKSILIFKSMHSEGIFLSITRQAKSKAGTS